MRRALLPGMGSAQLELSPKRQRKPPHKSALFWCPVVAIAVIIATAATTPAAAQDSGYTAAPAVKISHTSTALANAIQAAKDYLSFEAFSKKGLIEQLSSKAGDGYSRKIATEAVDRLKVNWQKEAVKAAREYLNTQAFSRRGLISQLSSDAGSGFPRSTATKAVGSMHINWDKQAVKAAKEYLKLMPMSKSELVQQLESAAGSGFTHAQAVYGANAAYK